MKKTIFDLCTDVSDCFVAVIEVRLFLKFFMAVFIFLISLFPVRSRVNALSEKEMPLELKGARERSSYGGHNFPAFNLVAHF